MQHLIRRALMSLLVSTALLTAAALPAPVLASATKMPRARDLGIPFQGIPGPLNAITDVAGVEVGEVTLIRGEGPLVVGKGPVRTGVTVIFPLGKAAMTGVAAAHFTFNGDGEMTGSRFVDEFGELHGPIALTNTLSVGMVSTAIIEWNRLHVSMEDELYSRGLPLVTETWDGDLNDIYGQHVHQEDVFRALDGASGGPVAEGNVGGGTGMRTFEFSGGTGTASRVVKTQFGTYTVGVLVQSNFGVRSEMLVAGVPVGAEIPDLMPKSGATDKPEGNSCVVIIATDAPLIPTQLKRIARRATLGLGRVGSNGDSGSGTMFPNSDPIDPLFEATVQATEEAIINAIVAGRTMTGVDGYTIYALPHERMQNILRKYGRLESSIQ